MTAMRPGAEIPDSVFLHGILRLRASAQVPLMDAHGSARGGVTRRRKARGDSLDTQRTLLLHKIIIHNVSNDPDAIRDAHEVFSPL